MQYKNYTQEEFIDAVKTSTSIRQVLITLGLAPKGGNYQTVHKQCDQLGLDTSHFTGKGWSKNKTIGPKRDIQDYLTNQYPIQSNKLRKRLLAEGLFEHKCYNCGLSEWLNSPIPLELEHINGNHNDNTFSNLTLLCPNCHALTPTYRGKNINKS